MIICKGFRENLEGTKERWSLQCGVRAAIIGCIIARVFALYVGLSREGNIEQRGHGLGLPTSAILFPAVEKASCLSKSCTTLSPYVQ